MAGMTDALSRRAEAQRSTKPAPSFPGRNESANDAVKLTVRMSPDMRADLKVLAAQRRCSVQELVLDVLQKELDADD